MQVLWIFHKTWIFHYPVDNVVDSSLVSINVVNMLCSLGENLKLPFTVSNQEQTVEVKSVSTTAPFLSTENTSEFNVCTSLKEKLKNQHYEFQCKKYFKTFTSKQTSKIYELDHNKECKSLFKCHVINIGYTSKEMQH